MKKIAIAKRVVFLLLALTISLATLDTWAQLVEASSQTKAVEISSVSAVQEEQGNPNVKVWVNTASGVYHCPGSRWYGKTKRGEYLSQAEAQKKRYRPAYGKVCR